MAVMLGGIVGEGAGDFKGDIGVISTTEMLGNVLYTDRAMAKKQLSRKTILFTITGVIILFAALSQQFGWFAQAKQRVAQQASEQQPGLYSIDHFIDGDTVAVKMNGKVESVRFIGVDTPETHKPDTPVQCYGPVASDYTKSLIGTHQVRLEADPTNQDRDRYGRLLRYVYLPDGRLLSEELVRNGYGFAYTQFPFTKKDQFVQEETAAKESKKGLWEACTVTTESNGRKQTNNAS
jgi:endonuclease YncB( thermonuclease family)